MGILCTIHKYHLLQQHKQIVTNYSNWKLRKKKKEKTELNELKVTLTNENKKYHNSLTVLIRDFEHKPKKQISQ